MRRFWFLLINEFRLARTVVPVHLIAVLQPTLMYALMTVVLVNPTFDVQIVTSSTPTETQLIQAMANVKTPAGVHYINPILIQDDAISGGQWITVEIRGEQAAAVQHYRLIDSNMVKNYRNRLTAAALVLWQEALGERAVRVVERPLFPIDIPYTVFFGMAMLPMTTMLAAALIGAYTTAQEFEHDTVREYRLAPTPPTLILIARLLRLILTGWAAAAILTIAVGWISGWWPDSFMTVELILLPIGIVGGCLGVMAGLLTQSSLPSFLLGLASTFVLWLLGGAFGLVQGFSGAYETVSRLVPNTHAVQLLFPHYYGRMVGNSGFSIGALIVFSAVMLILTAVTYQRQIVFRQR
ncbi:MAG: ABC transporter permease [Anaerolineales bacterium]|nr:ABC transporter permease [Anaerolineales bacterium]